MAKQLIQSLADSKIYHEYERAFSTATGLPLALRAVESWQLPHHGKGLENRFCALLAETNGSCAACLSVQAQLAGAATATPQIVTCHAGLCEIAVPIRTGSQLIGYLTTGQAFLKKPKVRQFMHVVKLLAGWGVPIGDRQLREIYFGGRVLNAREKSSVIKLLTIFAQHLSLVSNQIMMETEAQEAPLIVRAKQFIQEHQTEKLTLAKVAQALNTSANRFCKDFSKATGIHFTEYVARTRIERAKQLLLNPNLRVSEIAYEAGFQSLAHFNRVFKRILGDSPTEYRAHLAGGWSGSDNKLEAKPTA